MTIGDGISFTINREQLDRISRWRKVHDESKHIPPGETVRYSGAIGGAYTYNFTPTSLGVVVTVTCSCGEKIDVSDYDDW